MCQPADKAILSTNLILVEGYAIAGGVKRSSAVGNRQIERVELSLDLGTTWVQVQLLEKPQPPDVAILATPIATTIRYNRINCPSLGLAREHPTAKP
ncbi:MAG: hypothetical protein KME46_27435 [Brasilonema angustatum HA4187-MV1]|nr:hypothetical protein [Brasilonema angustatum HA4187-MV1]